MVVRHSEMEAYGGLVAGSHNRNELVVIRRDGDGVRHRSPSFDTRLFPFHE